MDEAVRSAAATYSAAHYPVADLVVIAGSALTGRRPRSDIDLVVVGPAAMFPQGLDEAAHTDCWGGAVVEVFASTPAAFRRHLANDVARLRPVTSLMLVEGFPVVDRGVTGDLLDETRDALAAGPRISPAALDRRRYGVTNHLDDLLDAETAGERAFLAARLVQDLAEFELLANGRWIASGRHLLRRLADLRPELAALLGAALAQADTAALERLTLGVLAPHGGRLLAPYRR